jgi:hypothetical protein
VASVYPPLTAEQANAFQAAFTQLDLDRDGLVQVRGELGRAQSPLALVVPFFRMKGLWHGMGVLEPALDSPAASLPTWEARWPSLHLLR